MPSMQRRQETGGESHESVMGDAVPHNGVEDQAARRAHMREQTTARQAAERASVRPDSGPYLDTYTRGVAARERAAALDVELRRINAAHQTWLREHEPADPPQGTDQPLPEGYVAPE